MTRFGALFVAVLLGLFALELTAPGQQLVQPWTAFVADASASTIRAFDGDASSQGNVLFSRRSGFAVAIEAGCNGVEAMLVLAAAMLAFPAPWLWKLGGVAIGAIAIQALNLLRVISLYYLGQWSAPAFEWAHLYGWQALIMIDALIVWLVWIRALPRTRS